MKQIKPQYNCSLELAMELVGGKWKLVLLWHLLSGTKRFSEIKRKLVEDHGIPAQEIRFIQEAKTDKAQKTLIAGMNEGTIRVLFGSTSASLEPQS